MVLTAVDQGVGPPGVEVITEEGEEHPIIDPIGEGAEATPGEEVDTTVLTGGVVAGVASTEKTTPTREAVTNRDTKLVL